MRALLQRVARSSVTVDGKLVSATDLILKMVMVHILW